MYDNSWHHPFSCLERKTTLFKEGLNICADSCEHLPRPKFGIGKNCRSQIVAA